MSTPRLRWRPQLFAALGAAFTSDPSVRDGIHLRWFSDARLGMALRGTANKYHIYRLRIKETSIEFVDLFKPSTDKLPVRSSASPSSGASLKRDGNSFSFQRRSINDEWSSLRQYFSQRQRLDLSTTDLPEKERALLDYMDGVMRVLDKQPGDRWTTECEQVVAVDVRFEKPSGPSIPIIDIDLLPDLRRPDLSSGLPVEDFLTERLRELSDGRINTDLLNGGLLTDGSLTDGLLDGGLVNRDLLNEGILRPWFNRVYARVEAYDDCDRMVDSDWVGWVPDVGWRVTAQLRAPGISRVAVLHQPALQTMSELETRWVFCDEFANANGLWIKHSETDFDPQPGGLSADFLKNRVFAAFHADRDWTDLAQRVRSEFLQDPSLQASLAASDTFAMFGEQVVIEDGVGAQPGEPTTALPILASLLATAIDPAVANLLGLHSYIPPTEFQSSGLDWKVEAALPFFDLNNLQSLDSSLSSVGSNPGVPFFHTADNPLIDLRLAGLVLNAAPGVKPELPEPTPTATASSMVIARSSDEFSQLVNAAIQTGGPRQVMAAWQTPACYEVIRSVTGEPTRNIVSQDESGPLDDFGVIPDVVLPEVDHETCLPTGNVKDVFSVPADRTRELIYDLRAFDIFGRPSKTAMTPPVKLHPPCRVPAAPNVVEAKVLEQSDQLALEVIFTVPETIHSSIHALPRLLTLTVLRMDASDSSPPDDVRWAGSLIGRQVSMAYDASGERLDLTPSTSCQLAVWSGDNLDLSGIAESSCSLNFPSGVSVIQESEAGLPDSLAGLQAFRLSVPLGARGLYPTGTNAWMVRGEVIGNCPIDDTPLNSAIAVSKATHFVRPDPPPIQQPVISRLPLSTRADHLGKSYFSIDLRDFLASSEQRDDALVKVLLVRLDKLTDRPEDFVVDGNVLDMDALIGLARGLKDRFRLLSDPPERFNRTQTRVDVPVSGNLEAVYLIAVVGTTPFLEESPWRAAGITAFRTPPIVTAPNLSWETARIGLQHRGFSIEHKIIARFSEALEDPTQLPKLQVMRRSLSVSGQAAQYLDTVEGTSENPLAAEPIIHFTISDREVQSWQRYEYSGQLLVFISDRNQRVRVGEPVRRLIDTPWDRVSNPFERFVEPLLVTPHVDGGFALEANFEPGEFELSIQKVTDTGVQPRVDTAIRGAQVKDKERFELDPQSIYTLRFHDDDTEPGTYVLRLALGQQRIWSTRAETP